MTTDSNIEEKTDFTLKVLSIVREAQLAHGLRHNDYQQYRQYCTRRIRRIRKHLGLMQGDRKSFKKKELDANKIKDKKYFIIPLMIIERCWAYAMQLKEESLQDSRKKFAMRNKLRKAYNYVLDFEKLVENNSMCDARTQLEVQGYSLWLRGTVLFEMAEYTNEWEKPVHFFTDAQAIFDKLGSTVSEDEAAVHKKKVSECEAKLRYCRHQLGDKAATDKLLQMRDNEDLGAKLDKLLASTKERQASTLSEVKWKGRTLSVKNEKVRLFLLNAGLINEELAKTNKPESKADILDKLLMDCKDALQIIREDLTNDPSFKNRQQASEGPVSTLHFLYTHLCYLRINLTVLRNLSLYHSYGNIINGRIPVEGKKAPKYQDIVRLCDIIVQNLNDITSLAGLEDDLEEKQSIEGQIIAFRALRCFYVAEHYAKIEKYVEALALYERTSILIEGTRKYDLQSSIVESLGTLKTELTSRKYTSHAQVLLSEQKVSTDSDKIKEEDRLKMLIDRLDIYMEDPSLSSKHARVAPVPPKMVSVACKPLFFDLALNHIDFPNLSDKTSPSKNGKETESPAANAGGIRGLVKGLWGWGS